MRPVVWTLAILQSSSLATHAQRGMRTKLVAEARLAKTRPPFPLPRDELQHETRDYQLLSAGSVAGAAEFHYNGGILLRGGYDDSPTNITKKPQ